MTKNVIVLTGANQGIGFHMTKTLLNDGFDVAALDVAIDNLTPLKSTYPERLLVFDCDVSESVRVHAVMATIVEQWEQVDVLVNNAALAIFKPFEQKPLEETRWEFEVNYYGYLHTISAVLPYMKTKRSGLIHNVSSGVGITGFPGLSGYASTKGAIEALTRTLAMEMKPYGIQVNLMHPPLTNTKSASPLGVPVQVLADPSRVGSSLAKQILSTKPVIAADLRTAIYLFFAYRYPERVGKLLAKLTERSRTPTRKWLT
jgi:NAD(P)-dependent dehydrogenase (short-subunit alcohol dehydrogenase family)